MTANNQTLELIIKHGLSVRQIPATVTSLWSATSGRALKNNEELVEKNGRTFIQETRVPANAGMWMAKKCPNSDSTVRWNIKTDNLSNTLDEAVAKAVAN